MHIAIAPRAPGLSALALFLFTAFLGTLAEAAAPRISGTPPTVAYAATYYTFTPSASDADRDRLTFSIRNKPSFASFDSRSGRLSGSPSYGHIGRTFSNVVISVTDGRSTVSLPSFSVVVRPKGSSGGTSNVAPTISGSPSTAARVGTAYSFTPSASDANGDALTFSITNKPSWASFSSSTGRLSGTPSTTGTTSNIVIRVSDGKTSASLSAFSIAVSPASSGTTGAATLSWNPPTRNTDGSSLTNLAGYRINYGTSATSLSKTVSISNPGISTYTIDGLTAGKWYFSIKAYTSAGLESAPSSVVSKTIQ